MFLKGGRQSMTHVITPFVAGVRFSAVWQDWTNFHYLVKIFNIFVEP
jgi:hypothetical protein